MWHALRNEDRRLRPVLSRQECVALWSVAAKDTEAVGSAWRLPFELLFRELADPADYRRGEERGIHCSFFAKVGISPSDAGFLSIPAEPPPEVTY